MTTLDRRAGSVSDRSRASRERERPEVASAPATSSGRSRSRLACCHPGLNHAGNRVLSLSLGMCITSPVPAPDGAACGAALSAAYRPSLCRRPSPSGSALTRAARGWRAGRSLGAPRSSQGRLPDCPIFCSTAALRGPLLPGLVVFLLRLCGAGRVGGAALSRWSMAASSARRSCSVPCLSQFFASSPFRTRWLDPGQAVARPRRRIRRRKCDFGSPSSPWRPPPGRRTAAGLQRSGRPA